VAYVTSGVTERLGFGEEGLLGSVKMGGHDEGEVKLTRCVLIKFWGKIKLDQRGDKQNGGGQILLHNRQINTSQIIEKEGEGEVIGKGKRL